MVEQGCCAGSRLKEEFEKFGDDVRKILVDSSVEVIDRVRGLADGATKDAGDAAVDYVRRNPWKAAAAFVILGVALSAISSRKGSGDVRIE